MVLAHARQDEDGRPRPRLRWECQGSSVGNPDWPGNRRSEIGKRATHLHIFQAVLLTDTPQHILLTTLLHLSRQQELVQDKVCLLEVEDDVEFTHVAVVLVHLLHVSMDDFQTDQFVVG